MTTWSEPGPVPHLLGETKRIVLEVHAYGTIPPGGARLPDAPKAFTTVVTTPSPETVVTVLPSAVKVSSTLAVAISRS